LASLAVALAALAVALPAAGAATGTLSGSFVAGAKFPARTMTLTAPAGVTVDVPHMYIWENGGPVYYLHVAPMPQTGAVELVIDQSSSMAGAPLAHELAAARAIAAARGSDQKLGVVAFDSGPTNVLSPTTDQSAIDRVLSGSPWTGNGTKVLPAVKLALAQLKAANAAGGEVIVLSDGATDDAAAIASDGIAAAAKDQHVQISALGVRDHAFDPALLQQLAQQGGGQYALATGAGLRQAVATVSAAIPQSYLIQYRSAVPAGRHVAVKIHVDGISTMLHLGYKTPAPAPAAKPARVAPAPNAPVQTPRHAPRRLHASAGSVSGPTAVPFPTVKPAAAPHSFWTSSLGLLTAAGVCALLIALAIVLVFVRNPKRRALRRRVGTFIDAAQDDPVPSNQAAEPEVHGLLTRLLSRRRSWPEFVERVEIGRMKASPVGLVKRTVVASVLVAIVVGVVTGIPPLGLVAFLPAPFVLRGLVSRAVRKQRKLFLDQLPSTLQDLAGAMRSGRSFVGALDGVAETSAEPMRGELERATTDERLGLPLEETLVAIARRMEAKDMDQIAMIAALNRNSGSNVAEALERVAEGARERADLEGEMRSLTGQARMSSWILTGLPPVMLGALTVAAPQYGKPLFHTVAGVVLLVFATGLVIAGWLVMQKIVNPKL
jgi:tight adherence protein B